MAYSISTVARPAGRERALSLEAQLALLLGLHLLVWTWAGAVSRSNFDTAGDMVEAYAWAQSFEWGYYKHPPLAAWVVGLWFKLVPESHWGYALLAATNSAVGLAGLAALAAQFLPRRWVLMTVAVASLAPGITTLAMRFNANALLVSTWPWAAALFVRLMQRGRLRDALGCGVVAALAVLGKHFSAVLLASFLITALWLPHWRRRLPSPAVALALAVFLACLWPHFSWLAAQTESALHPAPAATGNAGEALMRVLSFALAQCVFPLLALLAFRIALVGPARSSAFVRAALAPLQPRSDAVWMLAVLPGALTMAVTLTTDVHAPWVWGLAIAAGLALLAAQRAHEAGAEPQLKRLWLTLVIVWLVIAMLAPLWWLARARHRTPAVTEPRQELALAVAEQWRREFGSPLRWVGGTRRLAASVAFYADEHPGYWSPWHASRETPWVADGDVRRDGAIIVCERADEACRALAQRWSADARALTVAKAVGGFRFAPYDYVYHVLQPQRAAGGEAPAE